ncbi:hypothetical protein [Ornithinimicrobium tianjinense]|uniref:DUF1648 domain-containing protein n=1 Tax=Ornithinimicrobium tianjinense TaxID=1195761 RepID=A0A917F9H7_9MICO|nr:hypothetical protein [Ornithinimicrobium tianjinense]GGF55570.1 hypothetical protein GCM10011366_24340 [Ornithinimicrobium tianjinense]
MNPRRGLAGLLAILPLAALLLTAPVLPPPDRVPTHWSGAGPDRWSAGGELLGVLLTVTVLAAVAAAAAAILTRAVPPAWSRWALALAGAVGWGAVAVYTVLVWRTGVDGPRGVGEAWVALSVVLGLVAGALTYAVHGRRLLTREQLDELVPERARVQPVRGRAVRPVEAWSTDVASGTMAVIGWGLLAVGVVSLVALLAMDAGVWQLVLVGGVLLGAGLLALAWARVRIAVDADGLTVRSQLVPVRLTRVRVADVAGVEVQVLDPMRWGGLGLRPLPDRTAYIVDGGPGLVVHKRDGRRLALQVTEGDQVARAGARTLLQAAGQRVRAISPSAAASG